MNYVLGKRIFNILNHVIFPVKIQISKPIDVSVFMFDLRMINVILLYAQALVSVKNIYHIPYIMYMLSGCELIDTENISMPSQNMKFVVV
jgi:hypothetical protein